MKLNLVNSLLIKLVKIIVKFGLICWDIYIIPVITVTN